MEQDLMPLDREWRWILRKRTRPLILADGAISVARSLIVAEEPTAGEEAHEVKSEIHLLRNQAGALRYQIRKTRNDVLVRLPQSEHPALLAYGLEVVRTLRYLEDHQLAISQQVSDVDLDRLTTWLDLVEAAAQVRSVEQRLAKVRSNLRHQTHQAVKADIPITAVAKGARRTREWVYQAIKDPHSSPASEAAQRDRLR
ncbi:hypothetical protein [Actinomadura nitritigenes]|uniref:hypothetical protein n=1 Tax=Actinomadura nitritigenes TaxID=134602 RepID=UPI003D937AC1